MKRKAGKDAAPQRVECPACGRCMPLAYIGLHLDSCVSGSSASGPSAAAAPPPPPALSLPSPPLPSLRGLVQQQQQQQQQPGHDSAQARRPGKEPGTSQAEGWPAGSSAAASEAAGSPPPPPPPAGRPASSSNSGSVTQPPWWQRVPAAPAAVGFKPGGQRLALRADALLATAYSELVPNFLPAELAEAVLREMQADSPGWGHMQWWGLGRGGKTAQQPGASSKTSSHYSFTDEAPAGGPREQHEQQQARPSGAPGSDAGRRTLPPAPAALRRAAAAVAAHVSARVASGAVAGLPLEAADLTGWAPTYCIANCYASGAAGLGAHSDRLTALGPCPIVASLTLGATRTFRLHRQQRLALGGGGGAGGADQAGGSGSGAAAAGAAAALTAAGAAAALTAAAEVDVTRVDVELAHNVLCVLWPPCQEAWKHEIPKTSQPYPTHRLAGGMRYNLTFRRHKLQHESRAPLCRCGRLAALHPLQRPAPGGAPTRVLRYFWACDSTQGPTCGFWREASFSVPL